MSKYVLCIYVLLTFGCSTFSYKIENTSDKCCIKSDYKSDLHYFFYEPRYPKDSGAYTEIKKFLKTQGFIEIQINDKQYNPQDLCQKYQQFLLVSVEFLSEYDNWQGQAILTGLSLGLIPTWMSTYPLQKYTFELFENCEQKNFYSFIEYEKAFFWLFAMPFSQLPQYKESGPNVGKGIIRDVFGNVEANKNF